MCSTGLIKRLLPFAITLIIGLFIASFFVDLTPRPFTFRSRRAYRAQQWQQMYIDEHNRAERLQRENDFLKQNPTYLKHTEPWDEQSNLYVPPPKAPRAH